MNWCAQWCAPEHVSKPITQGGSDTINSSNFARAAFDAARRAADARPQVLFCARVLIAGIELMHMIKKGQLDCAEGQASPAASKFYSPAY